MNAENDDFGRSFLDFSPAPVRSAPADTDDSGVESRPYLLTGGRTGGGRADVKVETMVVTNPDGQGKTKFLTPEQEIIVSTAREKPLAVAEISAGTGLMLGVVQVLVGDLVHDGLLLRSHHVDSIHDDIAFLERLIACVAAL